nr:type II 3-dehydroquinate dehydratase [Nakamurella lactea]
MTDAPDPTESDAVLRALSEDLVSDAERELAGRAGIERRKVLVLNGVNLGRLGVREPNVYGNVSHAEIADRLVSVGASLGLQVEVRQTDDETELVHWLHEAADGEIPVVLNPAAWSHYSIALRDAASQRTADLVEVHLSNIHTREEFRHHSVISAVASGVIAGLGPLGYELALQFIAARR